MNISSTSPITNSVVLLLGAAALTINGRGELVVLAAILIVILDRLDSLVETLMEDDVRTFERDLN